MNIKDITNPILDGIMANLAKYNFKLNRQRCAFRRKEKGFAFELELFFHKDEDGILIEPEVIIQCKPIEDIFFQAAAYYPEEGFSIASVYSNMFKISEYMEKGTEIDIGEQRCYYIRSEDDIETVIGYLSNRFIKYIIPYFAQNNTVEAIDRLLNANPSELSIHQNLYPQRACLALIAARLNNNPEYRNLLSIYNEHMKKVIKPYRKVFNKLKVILKKLKT